MQFEVRHRETWVSEKPTYSGRESDDGRGSSWRGSINGRLPTRRRIKPYHLPAEYRGWLIVVAVATGECGKPADAKSDVPGRSPGLRILLQPRPHWLDGKCRSSGASHRKKPRQKFDCSLLPSWEKGRG